MPYRRLPNTDAARIRALRSSLEKGKELPPQKLAYSPKLIVSIERLLPRYETSIQLQKQAITSQNKRSRDYNEVVRKARLYLTHFIRVMNMAIYRGDLPSETRAYYGFPTNDSTVPALNTENELISWGRRIIEGEEFRIRKGGTPITNPTIAVVKVRFENFLTENNFHKTIMKRAAENTEKTTLLRKEADEVILSLWNEVEDSFSSFPEEERRKACEDYGIVYFYRKGENEKSLAPEISKVNDSPEIQLSV